MKKSKFIYLIPAVLALMVTLVLVLTVKGLTEHYRLQLLETGTGKSGEYYAYRDLDGDGQSEWFVIYYNSAGNLAVTIRDMRKDISINQFNFPGKLPELGPIIDLHDIDSNGIQDMFICTEYRDSLLLSIVTDPYGHPTRHDTYILDTINRYNENGDYHFSSGGLTDLDGDGSPEYICAINGGYSLQPRRVYAVNYRTGEVTGSPRSAAAVIGLEVEDLDQDGSDEILVVTTAPENFKIPFPYPDSISWLMVLDQSLDFYAAPVPLAQSKVRGLIPVRYEGKYYLLLLQALSEAPDGYIGQIMLFNDQLKLVKMRQLRGDRRRSMDLWSGSGNRDLEDMLLVIDDFSYHLDRDLRFTDSSDYNQILDFENGAELDLDNDGRKEYIYLGKNQVVVFREGLKDPVTAELYWDERYPRQAISVIETPNASTNLFVQVGDTRARFLYEQNPWFRLRALVYPGILLTLFGLLLGFILLIDKLVSRRYEKDRLISQLQLQSIKNQLDPHFTYNALNAVGSLIYKEEKDLAYLYLKGLTDLLRMVSGDAGSMTWTLSEELDFVQKYLEIEKLRFRDRFRFLIKLDNEALKDTTVPRMCILTFAENAIKHGLKHKKDQWLLNIEIRKEGEGVMIGIRDNGIGRAAAVKYRDGSTGQGMDMMRKYFRQFRKVTGKEARFSVTDLFGEDGKAAGTLVEITIS